MASPTRSAMIIFLKRNGGGQFWQGGRALQFKADFVLRKCKFVFVLAVEKLFMAIKLCLGDNCAWLGLPKARPANLWLKAKVICRTPPSFTPFSLCHRWQRRDDASLVHVCFVNFRDSPKVNGKVKLSVSASVSLFSSPVSRSFRSSSLFPLLLLV